MIVTIFLCIIGLVLTIGFIRVAIRPVDNIFDFMMDVMLIDLLLDGIIAVISAIIDNNDDD